MRKAVIVQIPFNVQGFNKKNEEDPKWIEYRLGLFIEYNLRSLKAQTNQWFTTFLRCRDNTTGIIRKKIGHLLPENVFVVGVEEYKRRTEETIKESNYFYQVRMDSDDMYEKNFIDMIHNSIPRPGTEVLISQECLTYDIEQKRLARFFYHSPQSYVLIYKTREYLEGKRHHLKNGHGGAILLEHEIIPGVNYMNTVHGKNDSSYFEGGTGGKKQWTEITDKEEIRETLKSFGITKGNK